MNIGSPIGQILITLTLLVVRGLVGEAAFLSWAWRIPFVLGFVIAVVGVVIRRRVEESAVFRRSTAQVTGRQQAPLTTVVRRYPKLVALLAVNNAPSTVMYWISSVYVLSYLTGNLGLPSTVGFSALLVANFFSVLLFLAGGALADRYGRKPVLYGASLIAVVGALLYFPLLDTRSWPLIVLATLLTLGAVHVLFGARNVLLAESFPTPVHATGYSITFTVSTLVGGLSPFAATALLHWTGTPWSIAVAMAATMALSLAVLPFIRETANLDIESSYAQRGS